jgi:hypothetical protein
LLIYVGAPALVIAAGAYCLRHRYGFARRLASFGALVMLVSASSVASLAAGGVLADRDIAAAKEYCQPLIAAVEAYHAEHGAYPADVSDILGNRVTPRLLRGHRFYWSNGVTFEMTFGDPRGMMNFIGYNSETHRWSEWH